MSTDAGNILIGLGVLLTAITAILFKIRCIRDKCAAYLVTEKDVNNDIEKAVSVSNAIAAVVPRAYWNSAIDNVNKGLAPNQIKEAKQLLEVIEGESSKK